MERKNLMPFLRDIYFNVAMIFGGDCLFSEETGYLIKKLFKAGIFNNEKLTSFRQN
jgi:hypothetical protein